MLKKILRKINVLIDTIKGGLLTIFVYTLIIIFICVILHNVLKMSEISSRYIGNYKNLMPATEKKMMNIYVEGEGDKTIVILPEFGSVSPVVKYKEMIKKLRVNYRVVVVEYLGYGFSVGTNEERTNKNIVLEIRNALNAAKIDGKYILVSHGISSIYAMYYSKQYPDEISSLIVVDGIYPNEISEQSIVSELDDIVNNTVLSSAIEVTGLYRILSYVKPDMFYINSMEENSVYTYDDIKVYRNRIGSSYFTNTMVREIKKLKSNMEELKDFKYPEYLPVLEIMLSNKVDKYSERKLYGEMKKDLKDFANDVITNKDIQNVVEIEEEHVLQMTYSDDIYLHIDRFINSYL